MSSRFVWLPALGSCCNLHIFDGYLSKLPAILGHQYDMPQDEDFHVCFLKSNFGLIKQSGTDTYDAEDRKFVRYIFRNGAIINKSGGSGYWEKEMLLPDSLSVAEGYLIYAHTMKQDFEKLLEVGSDYLKFEVGDGTILIRKVGSFLVISEFHAC